MTHRPAIYFADFIMSAGVGYAAAYFYLIAPLGSVQQLAFFPLAGLALFRAGIFIHEIVHMRAGEMTAFKIFWNVFYGVPMLTPSFMYKNHVDHHSAKNFGTAQDGEYQPFGRGSWGQVALYFVQVPLLPVLGILRFLILAPLSLIWPRLRRWVLSHASSYVSNFAYVRILPEKEDRRWWVASELAASLFLWAALAGFVTGFIPWAIIPKIYVLSSFAILLNWLRNLAGHRFLSDGTPMSHLAQYEESVTITGAPWLHELLFPVGMRYHALHHLMPALPYHNMGKVHRRLIQALPADSSYRRSLYSSYPAVMRQLAADIRAHRALPA